ncbi:MAG: cupredoxin domain-containing protein [Burkholderiales bacterium]
MRNWKLGLAAVLLALPASAFAHEGAAHGGKAAVVKEQKPWGIAGDAKAVTRTIAVGMTDTMRFTPDRIEVKQGETIRFTIRNRGKLLHEFVIGTKAELDAHAALMAKHPGMEHDEPYMAHVAPGKTGRIVWTFNRAGDFDFACLIAGHYSAGMIGRIVVKP